MDKLSGKNLELSIAKLKESIEDTKKLKKRLELNLADLVHYSKSAEQNLKYLKKTSIITVIGEYDRVVKSHKIASEEIREIEKEIVSLSSSISRLETNLYDQIKILERIKSVSEPKILPFRRKNV